MITKYIYSLLYEFHPTTTCKTRQATKTTEKTIVDKHSLEYTEVLIVSAMIGVSLLLNLWRLILGPSVPDRILALDTMYINSIALIVLYGIKVASELYFEAALLIAMLGFVSTVAICKFLLRGDIIE